jgi:hypothetical protein
MANSTHLNLPFIQPAQAGKHITHNEALAALDTLTQLAVLDRDLSTPPSSPTAGDRYIIAEDPTGAWAGKAGQVVAWDGAAWLFFAPEPGWLAYLLDEAGLVAWTGTDWVATIGLAGEVAMLGINATPDSGNRLAIASDAVLFTHAADSVRLKLNKAAAGDTASLLFQTGFSGRAEIGTSGDDHLHVKLSADGSSWIEAATIDATGRLGLGVATPQARLDVDGSVRVRSYAVAGVPSAVAAGQIIYVTDEVGGATIAFSDGASWRRVADRSVIS